MKFYVYLLALAVSSVAWAADPAADSMPATNNTPAASPDAQPQASEQQAAPAATDEKQAPAEQKSAKTSDQSGFSRGSVVRSVFTTAVKDREPVDKLNSTKTDDSQVYFFTELRDMSGQTAVHRWEHDGKVAAEVKFKVRGPRWRVWSSKTFAPGATGEWKVSVLNGAGEVIASDSLDYTGPAEETKAAVPASKASDNAPATESAPAKDSAPTQDAAPAQDTAPAQDSTPAQ